MIFLKICDKHEIKNHFVVLIQVQLQQQQHRRQLQRLQQALQVPQVPQVLQVRK